MSRDDPSGVAPGRKHADLARQVRHLLEGHLHVRHFRKGQLLWREGETSGMMVAIRSGRVKIYRLLPTGKAVTLLFFGPDDIFGFLPFLDGEPYPAYAQAVEDVEAEVIARPTLMEALRTEPDLALSLIALLGRRLRDAFEQIQNLSTPGARARVAMALVSLVEELGPVNDGSFRLPTTAQEFAGAIGIAPETLSRAMTGLADDGILERLGAGQFRVLDPEALGRAAEPPLH